MTYFNPMVLQVLILCSIINADSKKLAKPLPYHQGGLPERQKNEPVITEEGPDPFTFKELKADIDRLRVQKEHLKSRLDRPDSSNHRSDKQISHVKLNLDQVASKVEQLTTRNYWRTEPLAFKGLRADMERLRVENLKLKSRLDQQDSCKHRSDKQLRDVEFNLDQVTTRIEQLATRNSVPSRVSLPIAFSSYLLPEEIPYIGLNLTIVFNHELVNEPNCYDKTTGIFTAPISGVYMFSFYVYTDFSYANYVQLTVDDEQVITAFAGPYTMGGNVAVLRVLKGQRVQVKSVESSIFMLMNSIPRISTFSGFLLYA